MSKPAQWSRLCYAPALLLVYQVAPVQAHLDGFGRVRVALGFSGGRYQDREFGCGELLRSSPVSYRVIGGQFDVWPSASTRISAGGGVMHSASDSVGLGLQKGGYGSVLLAYEGKHFGIGGGIATWPGWSWNNGAGSVSSGAGGAQVVPAGYLRFGPSAKLHLRFDDNASSAPGSPPAYRFGLASGYSAGRQPHWFAGFTAREGTGGIGGELGLPLGGWLEPTIHGGLGLRKEAPGWNLGLAVRAGLGKPFASKRPPEGP